MGLHRMRLCSRCFIGNRIENLQWIKATRHKTPINPRPHSHRGCSQIHPSYRLMLMLSSFSSMFELVAERRFCLYLFVQASEHLPNNTAVPSSGHQQPETVSARFQNKDPAMLTNIWYRNPNNRKYMTKGASQLYLAMPFYTRSSTHYICGWRFILTTFEKKLVHTLIYQ